VECKEFRDWLAEARLADFEKSPPVSAHYESCRSCHDAADEEQMWQRLFASIPERVAGRSLWPGIALAIQDQRFKLSLSDALLLISRRLAPAFAILLVIIGALFLWNAPQTEATSDSTAMLETGTTGFIEEPDAVLISWAEARGQ
jgi:hypothetical protein